jgi:hypothetical protein
MWIIETLNGGNVSRYNASALARELPLMGDKIAVHSLVALNEINNGVSSLNSQMAVSNILAAQSLVVQREILAVQEEILAVQKEILSELREIKGIVNTLKLDERNDRRGKLLGALKYMKLERNITSDFLVALDSLNLQLKNDMIELGKEIKETRVIENRKNYALLMPLVTDIVYAYCQSIVLLEKDYDRMETMLEYALDWQEELRNHPYFGYLKDVITGGFLNAKQRNPIVCNFIINADKGFLLSSNNKDLLITRNKPNINNNSNPIKYGVKCCKDGCTNIVAEKYGDKGLCLYHIDKGKDMLDKGLKIAGTTVKVAAGITVGIGGAILGAIFNSGNDKK